MSATLKTGKLPATHDERDLMFADYVDLAFVLPKIPADFGHDRSVPVWGMLANGPDKSVGPTFEGAGDCVWAGAAHETMLWEHEVSGGHRSTWTGADVLKDYSAVTGYREDDPSTDQGTEVRTAYGYRQKTGIVDHAGKRHTIAAYAKLDTGNLDHVYAALYLFGAVGIGIEFPVSAMDQFNAGKPWDVVKGAKIDGGHYIPLVAKRTAFANGGFALDCVTWAKVQPMTLAFFEKYTDEAWVPLSDEHVHGGKTPEGFDMAHLVADLNSLKAG